LAAKEQKTTAYDMQEYQDIQEFLTSDFSLQEESTVINKTIGLGVTPQLHMDGAVSLVGAHVNNEEDLANVAQIVRNPGYETLHFIYIGDNEIIVHHEAISSRLPAQSAFFLEGETKMDAINRIHRNMIFTNAKGYYLLHNHPSGNPKPSDADISLTKWIANIQSKDLGDNNPVNKGFLGHVIINSQRYATIDKNGDVVIENLPGKDALLTASIPHEALGNTVSGPSDVAIWAKRQQRDPDISLIFYLTSQNKIRGVQLVGDDLLLQDFVETTRFIRQSVKMHYADRAVVVTDSNKVFERSKELIAEGFFLDAIHASLSINARSSVELEGNANSKWLGEPYKKYGDLVLKSTLPFGHLSNNNQNKGEETKMKTEKVILQGASTMEEYQALQKKLSPMISTDMDELQQNALIETGIDYYRQIKMSKSQFPAREFKMYHDSQIVENLLVNGRNPDYIRLVVAQISPIANQPGKVPFGYATHIVTRNQEKLAAIEAITNAQAKEGKDVVNSYRMLMKKQMEGEKLNASLDSKVVGILMRDFSPEEIGQALSIASPVVKEAGRTPESYIKFVVENGEKKHQQYLEYRQKVEATYESAKSSYLQMAADFQERFQDRKHSTFTDGKIAQKMLDNGHYKENVSRLIAEFSPNAKELQQEKGWDPQKYAQNVAYHVTESYKRQKNIEKILAPTEDQSLADYVKSNSPKTVQELYLYTAKHYLANNPEASHNRFVDTQIVKNMMPAYSPGVIAEAVAEQSPVAIEAGRDPQDYSQFVIDNACKESILEQQQQRVKFIHDFKHNPAVDKKPAQIYLQQANSLQAQGRTSKEYDVTIVRSMLMKGISLKDVSAAVQRYSPEFAGASTKEVNQMVKSIANDPEIKKQQQVIGR